MCERARAEDLLAWYDRHARDLPWRIGPSQRQLGIRPDPYAVWLSEIMLQQTTVATVKSYFERFTTLWPDIHALARADDSNVMAAWAGLGYYARARNLLKCARAIVTLHDGVFPDTRVGLLSLPGIGPYTAAAISAIAFDRAETVVDGNVERVMSRLNAIKTPLPAAKPELTRAAATLTPVLRPGDYAQAVMDLGATICTPRNPACGLCPWRTACKAHHLGIARDLPAKTPKAPKPVRHGIAYVVRRHDGAWLLERRPERGLLGGMLGWPCSDWSNVPVPAPPLDAPWRFLSEEARHTFTHFHLRLKIAISTSDDAPRTGDFIAKADFNPSDLPTVMRKVFDLAAPELARKPQDTLQNRSDEC